MHAIDLKDRIKTQGNGREYYNEQQPPPWRDCMLVVHKTKNADTASAKKYRKIKPYSLPLLPNKSGNRPQNQGHYNRDSAYQWGWAGMGLSMGIGMVDNAQALAQRAREQADNNG
jgi:hypothetical protein